MATCSCGSGKEAYMRMVVTGHCAFPAGLEHCAHESFCDDCHDRLLAEWRS